VSRSVEFLVIITDAKRGSFFSSIRTKGKILLFVSYGIAETPLNHWSNPVFEKTCSATQKNVKSHVFLDFEKNVKKRKKTYV